MASNTPAHTPNLADLELPRRFGQYTLVKRLGRGGMGDVFLATQKLASQERFVVVKTVRADKLATDEVRARFLDEARTSLLLSHRNICAVLDAGTQDGELFIAMEHVGGCSVRDLWKAAADVRNPLPPEIALWICCELLDALDYAHRLRHPTTGKELAIVHRDVSLDNVLISEEGEVKLIDFGIARCALRNVATEPGLVVGKLKYMAPEQAFGAAVDARADLFSTGVIAIELLSGRRFYDSLSVDSVGMQLVCGGYDSPALDRVSPALRKVLRDAVAFDPAHRPSTAEALQRALLAAAAKDGVVPARLADVRAFLVDVIPEGVKRDKARQASLRLFPRHRTVSEPTVVDVYDSTTLLDQEVPKNGALIEVPEPLVRGPRFTNVNASVTSVDQAAATASLSSARRRSPSAPVVAAVLLALSTSAALATAVVDDVELPAVQLAQEAAAVSEPVVDVERAPARVSPGTVAAGEPKRDVELTSIAPPVPKSAKATSRAPSRAKPNVKRAPVVDVEQPASTIAVNKPRTAPPTRPAARMRWLRDQCDSPCAAPLAARADELGDLAVDEVRTFVADVDACIATCVE